jgi:hypothetical protein
MAALFVHIGVWIRYVLTVCKILREILVEFEGHIYSYCHAILGARTDRPTPPPPHTPVINLLGSNKLDRPLLGSVRFEL